MCLFSLQIANLRHVLEERVNDVNHRADTGMYGRKSVYTRFCEGVRHRPVYTCIHLHVYSHNTVRLSYTGQPWMF